MAGSSLRLSWWDLRCPRVRRGTVPERRRISRSETAQPSGGWGGPDTPRGEPNSAPVSRSGRADSGTGKWSWLRSASISCHILTPLSGSRAQCGMPARDCTLSITAVKSGADGAGSKRSQEAAVGVAGQPALHLPQPVGRSGRGEAAQVEEVLGQGVPGGEPLLPVGDGDAFGDPVADPAGVLTAHLVDHGRGSVSVRLPDRLSARCSA